MKSMMPHGINGLERVNELPECIAELVVDKKNLENVFN
jgi:hypothetical protein